MHWWTHSPACSKKPQPHHGSRRSHGNVPQQMQHHHHPKSWPMDQLNFPGLYPQSNQHCHMQPLPINVSCNTVHQHDLLTPHHEQRLIVMTTKTQTPATPNPTSNTFFTPDCHQLVHWQTQAIGQVGIHHGHHQATLPQEHPTVLLGQCQHKWTCPVHSVHSMEEEHSVRTRESTGLGP